MFDTISLLIAPLVVLITGLIIEYWIIQPLNKSREKNLSISQNAQEGTSQINQNQIWRLVYSSLNFNLNTVSAKFVESFGQLFIVLPLFIASILATLVAIPLFIMLYISEKLSSCRYEPTCKEYLVQSIELYGPLQGLWSGFVRSLKCNPFTHGGHDPVPTFKRHKENQATKFDSHRLKSGLEVTIKFVVFIFLMVLFLEQLNFSRLQFLIPSVPQVVNYLFSAFVFLTFLWVNSFLAIIFIRSSWLVVVALTGVLIFFITRI